MASRLERGLRILLRLQHGVDYDVMKLAAEMNVTRRTIFRDIALLRKMGIPIQFDVESGHYELQPCDQSDVASGNGSSSDLDLRELDRLLRTVVGDEVDDDASIRRIASVLRGESAASPTALDARHDSDAVNDRAASASTADPPSRVGPADAKGVLTPLPEPFDSVCRSIASGEWICVVDQTGHSPGCRIRFIPTRLTFDNGGWRVHGATCASEPISLMLREIEIIPGEEIEEPRAASQTQETCK